MPIYILAIDTSTEACSVGLWADKKIFTQCVVSPREHTRKILPMIEQCLTHAQCNLQDIDVLAFGRGPGSFFSVRVAIGVAQGLAFGANLPMIGISSLLTMAQGAYRTLGAEKVLVVLDARMGEIYSACYELQLDGAWQGEETESLLKPEQFLAKINKLTGKWVIAGKGWSSYPMLKITHLHLLESNIFFPDAQDMLILALQEWKKGKIVCAEGALPVYLRNAVNWEKLPGR